MTLQAVKAAELWSSTRSAGKQLSDVDLLLAALAVRMDAVIVSNDSDFDALPARRET
jgi:predicted nucleic acid-binding protein